MRTHTKTKTKGITNTQLAVVTLVALAAGGAALATLPIQQPAQQPAVAGTCQDTDGGKDLFKQGTVTIATTTATDYCVDQLNVMERYCASSNAVIVSSGKAFCKYGCVTGACLPLTTSVTTTPVLGKDASLGNVSRVKGAVRQVVGQYIIKSGSAEDIRLNSVSIKFSGVNQGLALTYQNLELWNGAIRLGATVSPVANSGNSFNFGLNIPKNTSLILTLKADVLPTAMSGNTAISVVDSYNYTGVATGNSGTNDADVIGQTITIKAVAASLSAVSDASTVSRIYGPSGNTEVQLGKWKLATKGGDVILNKITFAVNTQAGMLDSNTGNFDTLALYDGANRLGGASYVAGYVVFNGLNFVVPADSVKNLTLKGKINGSGMLNSDHMNVFVIKSDNIADLELSSAESGERLTVDDINTPGAQTSFAPSTVYKFEDAYPIIANVPLISTLNLGSDTPVFKFTVTNPGTRDMRFMSTNITVIPAGMVAGGLVGSFKLWQTDDAGGLGNLLALNAATINGNVKSGITFDQSNDRNEILSGFYIPAGTSVTFVVTADTNQMLTNMVAGTVVLSASIGGTTGWSGAAWGTGGFSYRYTPVGGVETPTLTACDSYQVNGTTLQRSI